MKSKFQREQRIKIVFQKQKRKEKVPKFQESSLAKKQSSRGVEMSCARVSFLINLQSLGTGAFL